MSTSNINIVLITTRKYASGQTDWETNMYIFDDEKVILALVGLMTMFNIQYSKLNMTIYFIRIFVFLYHMRLFV